MDAVHSPFRDSGLRSVIHSVDIRNLHLGNYIFAVLLSTGVLMRIWMVLFCWVALAWADKPLFAVLPVKVDGAEARQLFTQQDISYLSDMIRAEASRILAGEALILS